MKRCLDREEKNRTRKRESLNKLRGVRAKLRHKNKDKELEKGGEKKACCKKGKRKKIKKERFRLP